MVEFIPKAHLDRITCDLLSDLKTKRAVKVVNKPVKIRKIKQQKLKQFDICQKSFVVQYSQLSRVNCIILALRRILPFRG